MTQPPNAPPPPPAQPPQFQPPANFKPQPMGGKKPLLPLWTGLGGIAIGAAATALVFLVVDSATASREDAAGRAAIQGAYDECSLAAVPGVWVGDDGTSATFDGIGEGGPGYADFACFVEALNIPDSVVSEMDQTRALDGRQDAEWDTFEASWTYHPDSGLNVVVNYVESSQ